MPNFRLIRRIKLAFINERISEEDWEKYHFDELNKRWGGFTSAARDWTIDRNKKIWLRLFDTNYPHYSDYDPKILPELKPQYWDYYWKGTLMIIAIQQLRSPPNENDDEITSHVKLVGLDIPENIGYHRIDLRHLNIPEPLINQQAELFEGIENALYTCESSTRKKKFIFVFEI